MSKKIALKLLFELVKNSKRSDRELAKILGVSQPTVTRMRQKLEKKTIKEYTTIPDWVELGYELMAFIFGALNFQPNETQELDKRAKELLAKRPNVIFASNGDGMGKNIMCISFHKNYTSFSNLVSEMQADWGKYCKDIQFFIVSLRGGSLVKPFSFKYLEKVEDL